jgi:RimJ/RimL family protein N-acetyltransferase
MNYDNIIIKTNRLIIKKFDESDFEGFRKINQDETIMKYFIGGAKNFRECLLKYQEILTTQDEKGYSYYAIYDNKTEKFMGQCGILENMDGSLNFCYAYDKKYWGKGYATEAGKAILDYLFNNFNAIKEITAFLFAKNQKSINLLKRLGFEETHRKETQYGEFIYYSIKNEKRVA